MRGLLRAAVLTLALVGLVAACVDVLPAEQPARKAKKAKNKNAASGLAPASVKPTLPTDSKMSVKALSGHIDAFIEQKLKVEKVDPSPRADDATFLRRVSLDITGKVPTPEQAVSFLGSKDSDKRAKLIDELLASKDYGRHQADVWQNLLLPRDSDAVRLRRYFPNLTQWLEESFNANKSWDGMVREVLGASGPVDKPGPGIYYLAHTSVDRVTDNFTKVFLGVQLQCAQCHNHPFTDWNRDEYWGMAAFFMKVRPDGNPKAAAKNGASVGVTEGRQVARNKRLLPESAKILPPKFLQGDKPKLGDNDLYRPALSEWTTSSRNPFLAKALVNRVWAQFLGRGIVSPVDDMHEGNTPSHPELLADLSAQFVASGFDVKHLIRAICNSEAYQRSSKVTGNNGEYGPEMFARMAVKVLTPEQLYDSLTQVLGKPEGRQAQAGKGAMAARRGPVTPRDQFVAFFQGQEGADLTEYQAGIPQVLRLMNAPAFNNAGAVAKLTRDARDGKEAVEKLYLAALARRPTSRELADFNAYRDRNKDEPNKALADLLWALVNCSEFSLNR